MRADNPGADERGQRKASARKDKASSPPKNRKKRSKRKTVVRRKAYRGVFSDLVQQVAIFEYGDRAKAEKTARELTKAKKGSYFVMMVKQTVE